MFKSGKKIIGMKNKDEGRDLRKIFFYYVYLVIVWGFFRLLFKLPEVIEEFWIKPVIWLAPLLGLWVSEKKRVAFFQGSFVKALVWGIGLGIVWMGVASVVSVARIGRVPFFVGDTTKYGDILGAAFATAVVEELVFSGYIFQKLYRKASDFSSALITTCVMFSLIHVPIGLFVYKYSPVSLLGFLVVVGLVEAGSCFLMSRTRNVAAPMIAHFMWAVAMTVIG